VAEKNRQKIKKPVDKINLSIYSLSMKKKAPQKGQLWTIGNKVYRIVKIEGDKAVVNHHEEMAMFYVRHLQVATPSQVAEYLGK
jgi:hypothetical protein